MFCDNLSFAHYFRMGKEKHYLRHKFTHPTKLEIIPDGGLPGKGKYLGGYLSDLGEQIESFYLGSRWSPIIYSPNKSFGSNMKRRHSALT